MEIDKKALTDALAADPAVLENLARQIAATLGLPEEKALAVARNSALIRARIEGMSERDLQNAAAMLGEENAAQIMRMIGGNGKQ